MEIIFQLISADTNRLTFVVDSKFLIWCTNTNSTCPNRNYWRTYLNHLHEFAIAIVPISQDLIVNYFKFILYLSRSINIIIRKMKFNGIFFSKFRSHFGRRFALLPKKFFDNMAFRKSFEKRQFLRHSKLFKKKKLMYVGFVALLRIIASTWSLGSRHRCRFPLVR